MTGLSLYAPEISRWDPPSPRAAPAPMSAARKGAIVTGACVAVSFAIAMMLLPPLQTPERVAITFVEARLAADWPAAWDVMCTRVVDAIDYPTFAETLSVANQHLDLTPGIDVGTDGLRAARGKSGPYLAVDITMTYDDGPLPWVSRGEVPIVVEDGEARVCPDLGLWEN